MTQPPRHVVVTSAPPNPNGDLHLGHLSGPFLGADVATRYLRQRGHQVVHVGYCDDYSCYVPRRAEELGLRPAETAFTFGRRMEQTLTLAGMSHDYFTHPLREPAHAETVRHFFTQLWESGAFEVRELPAFWCTACERYLYEAEMRGRCQYCSAPADGFYCEECGRPQETDGLAEPACTRCGGAPERRSLPRITFPLDKYRQALRDFYAGRPMRPRLRAYLDGMLSRPLPVTTVSRESPYGIPVPLPGWEGHILDTWYSGIWGYIAASQTHSEAIGDPAGAGLIAWTGPGSEIYEFIGYDCSFSHAILWPALFLAHGGLNLPTQVITNEFYQLEGGKFSTSRGHAIWGNDFLRQCSADALRFHLCLTGPEREQTNFTLDGFHATADTVLASGLQWWLDRVTALTLRDFDGQVPAAAADAGSEQCAELWKHAETLPARVASALEPAGFSPRIATEALAEVIEFAAAAAAGLGAPGTAAADYAAELAAHVELAARFTAVAAPVMPNFAEQTWLALGLGFSDQARRSLPWPDGGQRLTPAGHRIPGPVPWLFGPAKR